MDYNILKKSIKFKDRNFPVEIFCEEEYKDYYVRGQVIELSSKDYFLLTTGALTSYHFIIFVLVHKKYIKEFKSPVKFLTTLHNSEFCTFSTSTPEDFRLFQKMGESKSKNNPLCPQKFKGINKNPLITLKLKDTPIFYNQYQYLKESIEDEKKIILLDLSVHLNKEVPWQKYPEVQQEIKDTFGDYMLNCSTRIHGICGYHFLNKEKSSDNSVFNWFDNLYENIYWKLGYHHLAKNDFFKILSRYGRLSHTKIFSPTKPINLTKYITLLNVSKRIIRDDIYPLTRFCNSFYYDLIDDLKSSKIINQCQLCSDYFKYRKNKKYCNEKYDGKNCDRKSRNARYNKKLKDKEKDKKEGLI